METTTVKSDLTIGDVLIFGTQSTGINWCINCVGFHPSDMPSLKDFYDRLHNPQKTVMAKNAQTAKVIGEYHDKSCLMCGRTYNNQGNVDETWELTAKRVKLEFDNAGIFGVADEKVKEVVAKCRKSFQLLLLNRFSIPRDRWQYLTFSGQLAFIITVAQETRSQKMTGMVEIDHKG